jgi:L-ribulose-5-phosphate 3-epimerase
MFLGYNTNGFAHHTLDDTLTVLAELGYGGVALTPDVHTLNPYEPDLPGRAAAVRRRLEQLGLRRVVETGARFLLDPRRKHRPTLLSALPAERGKRLDFLKRCVELAKHLGAGVVSFWSGTPDDDAGSAEWMGRLADGCRRLSDAAAGAGVRLAFEPEPGMFIDTLAGFAELRERVDHPAFGLTIDVGHVICVGEGPLSERLRAWREVLWNVHLDDMRPGVHDHLMFGEGEVDVAGALRVLREIGFDGGACVELSRHSHDAVETARRCRELLAV